MENKKTIKDGKSFSKEQLGRVLQLRTVVVKISQTYKTMDHQQSLMESRKMINNFIVSNCMMFLVSLYDDMEGNFLSFLKLRFAPQNGEEQRLHHEYRQQ